MRRLLAHRPDAVFACNDMMAAGALQAIAEAGLRVPDDIAVMGFDDLPIASRTNPPLSTVSQDVAAIGAAAVDLLIKLVAGEISNGDAVATTIHGPLVAARIDPNQSPASAPTPRNTTRQMGCERSRPPAPLSQAPRPVVRTGEQHRESIETCVGARRYKAVATGGSARRCSPPRRSSRRSAAASAPPARSRASR